MVETRLNKFRLAVVGNPNGIYLFKANNGNIGTLYKICSKLTIKIPERRH